LTSRGARPPVEEVAWGVWADCRAGVGENPMWDEREQALYWIDIMGPSMHRSSSAGADWLTWPLPAMAATFARYEGADGALVVLEDGIYDLRPDGGLTRCLDAPYDRTRYRFNDGRCDPVGRLWVGTNRRPGSAAARGSASFWRLDERGLLEQFDGITIANGTAFSPDGSTMYVADYVEPAIWAFDYDVDTGAAANRRVFAELEPGWMPDGAAVDRDGGYWIALYGEGLILRFDRCGTLDRVLRAPVAHPTMVAFGGEGCDRLFVTSGREFVPEDVLAREPQAGAVFVAEVGAGGIAEPRFAFRELLLEPSRHQSINGRVDERTTPA